jgi:hypothetical protein
LWTGFSDAGKNWEANLVLSSRFLFAVGISRAGVDGRISFATRSVLILPVNLSAFMMPLDDFT